MIRYDACIVGGGFTGLTAALKLSEAGLKVCVIERDSTLGGLAGTFKFQNGVEIEKFYHHWFTTDKHVMELIELLGLSDHVIIKKSRTGMYYTGRIWKLSSPLDLLKFNGISFLSRMRLGLVTLAARGQRNWSKIESLSIREWLEPKVGREAFRVVWEPLIKAKFSSYAEDITAVWMWKKLVLRGGTRNNTGGEQLAYFRGGFGFLAQSIADKITELGGVVLTDTSALEAVCGNGSIFSLKTNQGEIFADDFIFTGPLPEISTVFYRSQETAWRESLDRVNYLGNICLVLQLSESLSNTYWLNVNDPGFPFVGVIEHTNLDDADHYGEAHVVYLSRYTSALDEVWKLSDQDYFEYCWEHLVRMFPKLSRDAVISYDVWRTRHAQAVTERDYSTYVPGHKMPYENGWIATMAQIYPEDRGTNYAIREGYKIASLVLDNKNDSSSIDD